MMTPDLPSPLLPHPNSTTNGKTGMNAESQLLELPKGCSHNLAVEIEEVTF